MISQRDSGELARFYTVTDPKKHQKGYTVYKVTARVSEDRMLTAASELMLSVVSLLSSSANIMCKQRWNANYLSL